jgi:hypothetical protein
MRPINYLLFLGILDATSATAAVISVPVSKDTTLFANDPDSNLGADDLSVGTTRLGLGSRALVHFNLAGTIPSGVTIQSVTLTLNVNRQSTSPQSDSYELHRFLVNWTEGTGTSNGSPALAGETTWNSRAHGATTWSTPGTQAGVEYVASTSGISPVVTSLGAVVVASTPGMVADVQQWANAPGTNFGWIVIAHNEGVPGTARRFTALETGAASAQLQITYVPEPTSACLGVFGMLLCLKRSRRCLLPQRRSHLSPLHPRQHKAEEQA